MIRLTLGGRPVQDPADALAAVRAHGRPEPPELARCNSLVNPLGREPARGWLALLRSDVLAMGVDAALTLALDDGAGNTANVGGLTVCKEPVALTPSLTPIAGDSVLLVEVADARWLCRNPYFSAACDRQYNVRAPAYGGAGDVTVYCADSLNAGAAWTWAQMVADLWALLPGAMGAVPALPFSPDGTPEGWIFPGVSAWDALCDVLDRIGCAVRWTATTNAYDVVRVGAADAATATTLTNAAGRKIFDGEYVPIVRGKEPATVRVYFHRREIYAGTEETNTRAASAAWQLLHSYHVDVAGGGAGAAAGTVHPLWDDLPALYDAGGALTNAAALATRAAERAADYYRLLRSSGGQRLHQTYSGLLVLTPGSTIKAVAWRQRPVSPDGDGDLVTEVVRHPFRGVRVGDGGQLQDCCEGSTAVRPPMFGPQWPTYPITDQVLKIVTGTPSGGLYDCTLEKPSGATSFADKDSIWGLDLAGRGKLPVGAPYPCRLVYYQSGRPVYAFRSEGLEVRGTTGMPVPDYIGIDILTIDTSYLALTQPAPGEAEISWKGLDVEDTTVHQGIKNLVLATADNQFDFTGNVLVWKGLGLQDGFGDLTTNGIYVLGAGYALVSSGSTIACMNASATEAGVVDADYLSVQEFGGNKKFMSGVEIAGSLLVDNNLHVVLDAQIDGNVTANGSITAGAGATVESVIHPSGIVTALDAGFTNDLFDVTDPSLGTDIRLGVNNMTGSTTTAAFFGLRTVATSISEEVGGIGYGIDTNGVVQSGASIRGMSSSGGFSCGGNFGVNGTLKPGAVADGGIIINLGSGVEAVADGGTGLSSYTVGDLLYASGTTTLQTLAIGSTGDVLSVSGGLPAWAPGGSGTVTNVDTSGSLTGGPITTTGTLSLVNDNATPGNSYYYGTDSGGTKGFFALPVAGGIAIGDAVTSSTNYDILSIDGSGNLSEISPATAGYVLTSNGTGAAATFQALSLAIGGAITGGTAGRVLFEGGGPVLADNAGLTYSPGAELAVTSGVYSATLCINTGPAGRFVDGTNTADLCTSGYAANFGGDVAINGVTGGTPPATLQAMLSDIWSSLNSLGAPPW